MLRKQALSQVVKALTLNPSPKGRGTLLNLHSFLPFPFWEKGLGDEGFIEINSSFRFA